MSLTYYIRKEMFSFLSHYQTQVTEQFEIQLISPASELRIVFH